jgi:hypothetical protein
MAGEAPTALNYQPADTTLVVTGFDLGMTSGMSECVLGCGANEPAGVSPCGFTDTTYSPTTAQILAGEWGVRY